LNSSTFEPKAEFAAMLEGSDEAINLIRAALCIAGEHNPALDPQESYRRLEKLGDRAHAQIETEQSLDDIANKLCRLLYRQVGFCGDSKDYYNPDNSYIDRVLETRRGIPISLALVYISVGEALGLRVDGVGFPAHFLLKLSHGDSKPASQTDQTESVLIDPFSGQVLSVDDCKDLLAVSSGNTMPFKAEYLQTINKRAILRRMLGNLKGIYLSKKDYVEALSLCDRLLLLNKDAIQDRIDRAGVLEKLECYEPAAQDLEQILKSQPSMPGSQALERKIGELRAQVQGRPH